ncbi:integrase, catalytic region, zinc finger, CCHC-type containing protein [Tanacetum coccineum]
MMGNRSLLRNFVEKFMGTVRFGNDNFAAITGYGDYIHGNISIVCIYVLKVFGHNLFSIEQFFDGDLEVAFRSKTCYVRNLEGVDLLTGRRDSNLYTISISDMAASSPICLMSKATSTKSWLWHRRLSHLNFGTINDLTKLDLVDGLPKFKYGKNHLCSACERGKSKKASHPSKLIPSDYSKLELLHMDLCGPMRVDSINGKKEVTPPGPYPLRPNLGFIDWDQSQGVDEPKPYYARGDPYCLHNWPDYDGSYHRRTKYLALWFLHRQTTYTGPEVPPCGIHILPPWSRSHLPHWTLSEDEDEDEDEEEEEEHPAPADSVPPVHRMTARISIRDEPSISLPPREEVERLLALTTPPPSPLTPLSSPLPQIPSPTPNSPTHIEIPESCLPLRKRVRFASPTPSREVGESSAAGAARQDRPTIAREDLYGFVDMVDVPPRCSTSRELDYDIMDTWDDRVGAIDEIAPTTVEGVNQRVTDLATIVEEETTSMYGIMEDAQDDRSLLRARVNLLYRDRPVHRRLAVMIEREAKMAREAWGLSMDASDYARSDVMSLRTTVVAQSALISKLQSTDHKRQRVISELLASDHKRQVQLTKIIRLLKGLQTQMAEFQRQHGPAKGPTQPDAPREAGSSS